MSPPPKFLFDECAIGQPALKSLSDLTAFNTKPALLGHVLSEFGSELDDIWIPQAARDGWIIVSADRGKRPSKGGKLPKLCELLGVTHVLMSAALGRANNFLRQRSVIDNWDYLIDTVAKAPKGAKFSLKYTDKEAGKTAITQIEYTIEQPPRKSQRGLL